MCVCVCVCVFDNRLVGPAVVALAVYGWHFFTLIGILLVIDLAA